VFQSPELKIDKELEDLLFTDTDCTPLFHPVLIRRIRKKGSYQLNCPSCNPGLNGIKQGEKYCPYCDGVGYLWDEKLIDAWVYRGTFLSSKNTSLGIPLDVADNDFKLFYIVTHKSINLDVSDYVLIPSLDNKGRIVVPFLFEETFKVIDSIKKASNQRESEYNVAKLITTKEIWVGHYE
jgi:hypothetical protein